MCKKDIKSEIISADNLARSDQGFVGVALR